MICLQLYTRAHYLLYSSNEKKGKKWKFRRDFHVQINRFAIFFFASVCNDLKFYFDDRNAQQTSESIKTVSLVAGFFSTCILIFQKLTMKIWLILYRVHVLFFSELMLAFIEKFFFFVFLFLSFTKMPFCLMYFGY